MNKPPANLPQDTVRLLAELPDGWSIEQIAYVAQPTADSDVLFRFPASIPVCAVRVESGSIVDSDAQTSLGPMLLIIPVDVDRPLNGAQANLLETMQSWVDLGQPPGIQPSHLMTFQGVQICWSISRIAIFATSQRIPSIRNTVIEASYYETELRKVEAALGQSWPLLEADMPLAFEFNQQSIPKRKQLRDRFRQILQQQAHMARIGPYVHAPHMYPPTLASQISERLRDRTRMMHRHEFLDDQLEVFHTVYESCAQRSSDFMLARSGHTLEWIIIVILLVQTLFSVVEMMAGTGAGT
jgi:hypothetical protein